MTDIRVGTVSVADNDTHMARVIYQDTGTVSGWLRVVDNRPSVPGYDTEQRTEYEEGGGGYALFASHKHDLTICQWMPHVNDTVLCLCNGMDGFILGRLDS